MQTYFQMTRVFFFIALDAISLHLELISAAIIKKLRHLKLFLYWSIPMRPFSGNGSWLDCLRKLCCPACLAKDLMLLIAFDLSRFLRVESQCWQLI